MAFFAAAPLMAALPAAGAGFGGIGTAMTALSAVAGIAGTVMSAQGTLAAGKAAHQQSMAEAVQLQYQADQFEARGKWEEAKRRQGADVQKRRKNLALSRAQAVGAKSNFLPGDHSSSIAMERIERYGSFDEFQELAMGKAARTDNNVQAANRRYEGDLAKRAGAAQLAGAKSAATGTLIGGMGSLASSIGGLYSGTGGAGATTRGWGATVNRGKAPSAHLYG